MKPLINFVAPLALAACGQAPDLPPSKVLAQAADAQNEIRPIHSPTLLAGYTTRPVQGPENWRRLNDQQSPEQQEES